MLTYVLHATTKNISIDVINNFIKECISGEPQNGNSAGMTFFAGRLSITISVKENFSLILKVLCCNNWIVT